MNHPSFTKDYAGYVQLARKIGQRHYQALRATFPEDYYQIIALCATTCEQQQLSGKAAVSAIRIIFDRTMREYGWTKQEVDGGTVTGWRRAMFTTQAGALERFWQFWREPSVYVQQEKPRCSVKGCEKLGLFVSPEYGRIRGGNNPKYKNDRLCRRHYATVNKRKNAGDPRPYRLLEQVGVPSKPPKKNNEFWAIIHRGVSKTDWREMWLWAKGYSSEYPADAIKRARIALQKGIR